MTLSKVRAEWEKGMTVISDSSLRCTPDTFLVALRDRDGGIDCHRYFTVGGKWQLSVDHRGVTELTALQWALEH